MTHLVVERLRKVFASGDRTEVAVDGLDLTAAKGEFVSLLGPSGCGKTTTLRCIAGLEAQTSGTILIGGADRSRATPQERNIGMCFQEATVYPHMTVRDNLAYPLKLRGVARPEREPRVDAMARILKLVGLLDKYPAELSGGQRQRTALGRALIREPTLFLLDEPMSSLDAKLKVEMRKELKTITTMFGTTVLYVTHDQEEAMALSDRICVMNQGRIEQVDTPEAIYRQPSTTFVATFIGVPAMNLLPGRLDADGITLRPQAGSSDAGVEERADSDRTAMTVGVRPEDVKLDQEEDSYEGVVSLAEVLGERTILHLDSTIGEIRVTVHGISRHRVGGRVRFGFDRSALHVFDPDGRRVPDVAAPAVAFRPCA